MPPEFLRASLRRLDALLHREILRLRARYQLSLDEFRGLYVSDRQVDELLSAGRAGGGAEAEPPSRPTDDPDDARWPKESPWGRLRHTLDLDWLDSEILLLALAPELELKYETLYAYLNNDVTRKWPTVDLAVRVCSDGDPADVRRRLAPGGKLLTLSLLEWVGELGPRRSSLALGFAASEPVIEHLMGLEHAPSDGCTRIDARKATGAVLDRAFAPDCVERLAALLKTTRPPLPLVIMTAESTELGLAAAWHAADGDERGLLRVDLRLVLSSGDSAPRRFRELALRSRLIGSPLLFDGAEALTSATSADQGEFRRSIDAALDSGIAVFVAGPATDRLEGLLEGRSLVHLAVPGASRAKRLQLWEAGLRRTGVELPARDVAVLADQFRLSPSQIPDAVADAALTSRVQEEELSANDSRPFFRAARARSAPDLGRFAHRVSTQHAWEDLVLPDAALRRVREIVQAIRRRREVFEDWGFAGRGLGTGGLTILFSGASGTGKTLTAAIIASQTELDLYVINLALVVSKYIGETEKNLDAIFTGARRSSAILFFDEADALFGKRAEIQDARDRYANVETAYLLQRVEAHDGVVILATNWRRNIDEAFNRRIHFAVEYPRPGPPLRERLWRKIFPAATPVASDVDYPFLAAQFDLTGGDIRNVALDAAFAAASDGRVVNMATIVKAVARHLLKKGKAPGPADFKQYHELVQGAI